MGNTDFKATIAEQKVILKAVEHGLVISRPVAPARYDMIIDYGGKLERTQVKYADNCGKGIQGAVRVHFASYSNGKPKLYQEGEIDVVLAYLPAIDKIVRIEPGLFINKRGIMVRYADCVGKQKYKCNYAKDMMWEIKGV